MATAHNSSKARSIRGILPLVAVMVALAGPQRLWGQDCQQAITSVDVTPGSVIALASGPAGSVSGTVYLNCPIGINGTVIPITITPSDGVLGCGGAGVQAGTNYGTFGCTAVQGSGSYTLTATLNNTTGNASVTVTPLEASIAVSPTTLVGGSGETATVTVTTNAPVRSVSPYIGQFYNTISNTCNNVSGSFDSQIYPGNSTTTTTMGAAAVSTPTLCSFTVQNWIWGGPTVSGSVMVLPASSGTPPAQVPAVNTVCKECQLQAGAPINLSSGDVWIQEKDYSVPGLGGGLTVTRTWNSLFPFTGAPALAGMFGLDWKSTYEEQISAVNSQTVEYWRGDGSAWTFVQNSALNSYALASPPDERAQLVGNLTGGFTITFADGTQKVFNAQNLLSTIIDRNNNQTTLAYDGLNRLISVTSPGGSTLTFTYGDPDNPLQATLAQDSVGTVATYTYDSLSRLTQVLYPDGSQYNFTYDPTYSMILSVTDSQGKLIESHTYDSQNRGLTSTQAYGANSVSLTY